MLHGVPVQVFELDHGYVVSMSFQGGKTKKHHRRSVYCETSVHLGETIARFVAEYENRAEM